MFSWLTPNFQKPCCIRTSMSPQPTESDIQVTYHLTAPGSAHTSPGVSLGVGPSTTGSLRDHVARTRARTQSAPSYLDLPRPPKLARGAPAPAPRLCFLCLLDSGCSVGSVCSVGLGRSAEASCPASCLASCPISCPASASPSASPRVPTRELPSSLAASSCAAGSVAHTTYGALLDSAVEPLRRRGRLHSDYAAGQGSRCDGGGGYIAVTQLGQ